MRILLRRRFKYMDGTAERVLAPGEHDVDATLASKAVRFGGATIVAAEKAKKKKPTRSKNVKALGAAPENKAGVE